MNIAIKRKERQMTQEELAQAMGVDRTTVTKWESRESFPRAEMLMKLARFFNCTVDEILGKTSD